MKQIPMIMNVNTLLNTRDRLAFVNTYPRSPSMTPRGMIHTMTPSAVKKDPEVMAASALASLLTSDRRSVPVALQCQQYLQREPQQVKAQPTSKKLELPERFTKNGRRRAVPFPLKLMQVLSDEQYCHIITWMPNGRSFVILRPKAFVSDILPKHFKSAQYASFTRKLARWGFTRCEDGTGEFFHPQFLKGRLDLAEKMACLGPSSNFKSSLAKNSARQRDAPSPTIDLSQDDESPRQTDESVVSSSHSKSTSKIEKDKQETEEPFTTLRHVQQEPSAGNDLLGVSTKKNHMLQLELEAMRLRRYIHAAALSRRALVDLQRQSVAPYLKSTDRAALHGLPDGLNPYLYSMPGASLSPMVDMRGIYARSHGTSMPVRRFPNMKGAKTA